MAAVGLIKLNYPKRGVIMQMYCVYDRVAGEASAPFLQKNDDCARRMFRKLMIETNMAGRDDFDLYYIGVFNECSMSLHQTEPKALFLMNSSDVVVPKDETIGMFPAEEEEK